MVRVQLRGGVWKNSEDEILKAAVQKYGKQQWARVASLLNRKTAKQAKARWFEWLDPSIKKTEWTRAEDEKLLHLAKLMPAQWKTIAPLVGRTATQCQEHYEELLDQAATGSEAASDARQQQQLRPGQIDSHPETKPARPDPIDMDEDEMEMLQEARARLANTQGKKAKRKQREKMLAEAKRLADLQKRRELKQAGLLTAQVKRKKRRKEIDFGTEIPFYKPAAAGFHDTTDEATRSEALRQKRIKSVNLHQVNENLYRSRDKAAAAAEKREQARMKVLEETNAKYEQQAKKLEEQADTRGKSRGLLELPSPTVTDSDLSQMARAQSLEKQTSALAASGEGATKALLGDYTDRPLPTPMRTPATARRDLVAEASQLRKLSESQTPLLPGADAGTQSDESGDEEANKKLAALPTPSLPDRRGVNATPAARRDELGLNAASESSSVGGSTFATNQYSVRELARQERRALKKARSELEAALATLPTPLYDYDLAAPMVDIDLEEMQVASVPDQADVEEAELEQKRKEAEKKFRERSTVMQRNDLPRPTSIEVNFEYKNEAERLVAEETKLLLQHDDSNYPRDDDQGAVAEPFKKKSKKKHHSRGPIQVPQTIPVELDQIPEYALDAARGLIKTEFESHTENSMAQMIQENLVSNRAAALGSLIEITNDFIVPNNESINNRPRKVPGRLTPSENIASLRREYDDLRDATEKLKKKNDKVASKLTVVNGGYGKRTGTISQEMMGLSGQLQDSAVEESVYQMLYNFERRGADKRIGNLTDEVNTLKHAEAELQKRYGELVVARRRSAVVASK